MPIVCACVPSFSVAVARREQPDLHAAPLLVVDRLERGHVVDLDAGAFALGARTGMTLLQASACAREASVAVDEPARNAAVWHDMLDALDAASPLVEDAAVGTAYLDMRGIAGTPQRWIASVREALEPFGLPLRIALAPNKFVARAAAFTADGTVVEPGAQADVLAPLPLHVLDCDTATIERLHLLGITTLGKLAALPHGPFVRRFGPQAMQWHAHARGIDPSPLVPRPRALRIDRSRYGEGAAEREDQLLFALRSLVVQVADDVAFAGKRCAKLALTLECEDASTHAITAVLARPTAQMQTMFDLLRAKLEGTTLLSPVVGMRLTAERLEDGGSPLSLFAQHDPDAEAVAIALARLEAALGPGCTLRARIVEGFRDESRATYEPFDPEAIVSPKRVTGAPHEPIDSRAPVFSYRLLLARPLDVHLEGGSPARIDGRRVLEHAGPWRVEERWWSEPLARHEYDVMLTDGALWRIARDARGWSLLGVYD
jgi:protein ImuB